MRCTRCLQEEQRKNGVKIKAESLAVHNVRCPKRKKESR